MSFSLEEFKKVAFSSNANLIYSLLILINHFAYGITANVLGATLTDLAFVYDVSIDTMTYVSVANAIGYMTGSLVGWLYKWLNRQVVLIFFVTVLALTMSLVPYYGKLPIAFVLLVVNGIGGGAWDASSGFWMVEMWPVGNAGMLQLMQCMYGSGAVVAPLLVSPYVHGNDTIESGTNVSITVEYRVHSLSLPFSIIGIIQAIVPTCWIILFFTARYNIIDHSTKIDNFKKVQKASHKNIKDIPYRKVKVALCGVVLALYGSAELGWFNFAATMYQYWDKNGGVYLEASSADHVLAVVFVTYAIGRLATAFITIKVIPDYIISYHFVLIYISLIAQFVGRANQTMVTLSNALLGYGFSAMWPAILAFTERHLQLSDRICSLYCFMAGTCSLIIPLVMGQTFKAHPILLFFLDATFITIALITFVGVWLWISIDNARSNVKNKK